MSSLSAGMPRRSLPALLQEEGHCPVVLGSWWCVPPGQQSQGRAAERLLACGRGTLAEEWGTWFWTRVPVGGHPALGFPT